MGKDETKRTMQFWIVSGIVAIAVSQIPLLLRNGRQQEDNHTQDQHKKKPRWVWFLFGAIFLILLLWLFNYYIGKNT
ncbi:hypothetical protein ACFLFF_04090 [Brevibacillus reuszeri]|uniref:hypothetical protein n=1 Tax=Brevibacillus reuszeri TaxID=54915 RepID=UPI00366B8982